jgi:hypothetical protein
MRQIPQCMQSNALLAMRCDVAMNLLNTARRGHALGRACDASSDCAILYFLLAKRPETALPVWHARPTSLVPILRYHPVFALRAGCGGRDKHAKEPRERRKFTRKFTRPVSLGSVAFAAPVLFLGPSSGRHHGMPFFGFLFFFHPGSVWMAPPRLSCRSIDLSWTPSA